MARTIILSDEKVAIVDDADFDILNAYCWTARWQSHTWYAFRQITRPDGSRHTIYMHRAILNPTKGERVDHRDRDGLNNRRSNLRLCTQAQNLCNRPKARPGTSRFKGVSWHKLRHAWVAAIENSDDHIFLGLFTDENNAARAYDIAAHRLFGEFAYLNFPDDITGNLLAPPKPRNNRRVRVDIDLVCEGCGAKFTRPSYHPRRYCGLTCRNRANAKGPRAMG